ncbi:hypothetical protein [Saliphagus infecundisoli]|uniref:Twin-arginine translocation signal domain-containing protein n=1 Tax=Saliphagus infecundisoli TaxID=1849069 RepID=A0ABD5QBE2_9EURY
MTDDNSLSRRDSLKGIAIGTALGGTALGMTGVAAGGDRDNHGHDNEDEGQVEYSRVRLIPECTEPALDVAVFRVDNHTEQAVDLKWRTERTEPKTDDALTFVDCETVRIVGDFVDVFLNAAFVDETGIGTLFEPVGSVEGERMINVAEEFPGIADEALAGPVITVVSLFRDEPGPGDPDISRVHPGLSVR